MIESEFSNLLRGYLSSSKIQQKGENFILYNHQNDREVPGNYILAATLNLTKQKYSLIFSSCVRNEWLPVQLLAVQNYFTEPGQYVPTKQIINLNTNISMFTATPCSRETVKSHRGNTNATTFKKKKIKSRLLFVRLCKCTSLG